MESVDTNQLLNQIVEIVTVYGLRVVAAIAILIVGRIAAGSLSGAVRKTLQRRETDPTLVGFLTGLVRFGILAFTFIAALGRLGIQTASFVAVLGAAGLAVGLALQGSLSNFAAGVLILLFRPLRVGDFVEAGGTAGSVKEIGILATTMATPDNKKIIVPNSQIMGGTITNFNANGTRRVDLTAGISYGDDIGKAKEILERILREHPKVLQDPAPVVELAALADSSVNFVVRPWTEAADYWRVYWDVTRSIKEEFDKAGVSIPFPQRDVHLYQESAGR
jgi:small conductance mechanosensitive channel